jgi:hypothetical protein
MSSNNAVARLDDYLKNMTPAQRREMDEAFLRTIPKGPRRGPTSEPYEEEWGRLSGAMSGDKRGKRPPKLQNWEKAAIEQMVVRTGLPLELFDSLTITERVGNPEDASSQARDFNLSEERIKALQKQLAKLRRDYKNAEMDDNRMGGDGDGGGRMSGSMGFSEEMDRVLETTDGDSAWEAWDDAQDRVKEKLDDMSLSELEDALDEIEEDFGKWGDGMQGEWNDTLADRLSWGDEEGVIRHLMRWEDMNKREAQKEASRLIDLYEAASQKEQAFQSIIGDLKSKIKELQKDDDDD